LSPSIAFKPTLTGIARGDLRDVGVHFGFKQISDIHFRSSSQILPFSKRSGRRLAVREESLTASPLEQFRRDFLKVKQTVLANLDIPRVWYIGDIPEVRLL